MIKLSILFLPAADPAAFEDRFSGQFLPRAEQLPGLRRSELTRVLGAPGSSTASVFMAYEWYFDDLPALDAAMTSPIGQELAAHLDAFGRNRLILFYGEAYETSH